MAAFDWLKYISLATQISAAVSALKNLQVGDTDTSIVLKGIQINGKRYDLGPIPVKRTR